MKCTHGKPSRRLAMIVLVTLLLAMVLPALVQAQSGGGYGLTWNTVDNGGGASSGSGYTLNGTIGQSDAGASSSGGYTLIGGFWGGAVAQYRVYLPLVLRNP